MHGLFSLASSPEAQRAARRNRIRSMHHGDAFSFIWDATTAAMDSGMNYDEARTYVRSRAEWDGWLREAYVALRLHKLRAIHRERITGWAPDDTQDKDREGMAA